MPASFLHDGPGAIALYKTHDIHAYYVGMSPTQEDLIDVVIYGAQSANASTLLDSLLPGQQQVNVYEKLSKSWGISRCVCCQTRWTSAFKIAHPTPLLPNNCSIDVILDAVQIIINEINPRNRGYDMEYIELKGPPDTLLNNFIVVLFPENGQSYYRVDLSGKSTDHDGFVVIGSQTMMPSPTIPFKSSNMAIIPPGSGAVALYRGLVTDFPHGTQMTAHNLLDVVVYDNDYSRLDNHMTEVLTPGSQSFYAGNFG